MANEVLSAGSSAAMGALMGTTAAPGVGTAVGAAIGLVSGALNAIGARKREKRQRRILGEMDRATRRYYDAREARATAYASTLDRAAAAARANDRAYIERLASPERPAVAEAAARGVEEAALGGLNRAAVAEQAMMVQDPFLAARRNADLQHAGALQAAVAGAQGYGMGLQGFDLVNRGEQAQGAGQLLEDQRLPGAEYDYQNALAANQHLRRMNELRAQLGQPVESADALNLIGGTLAAVGPGISSYFASRPVMAPAGQGGNAAAFSPLASPVGRQAAFTSTQFSPVPPTLGIW